MYTDYYHSPLGRLKLQATDNHLTALLFTEEADGKAGASPVLEQCRLQLDEYFSGQRKSFDLPLEQQGTGFQKKVWELLVAIPYGRTISYNDLALRYGDQKAIRAIAAANGKNNIAILVPCHRVIGSNRSLTGYAGGLWRKQWLLDHEAKHYSGVTQSSFF